MKLTSRNNDHLRSDDGRRHTHSPIPLIDSAHPVGCPSEKYIVVSFHQNLLIRDYSECVVKVKDPSQLVREVDREALIPITSV